MGKIDELLSSTSFIDWTAPLKGHQRQCHGFVNEIVDFLQATLPSLSALTPSAYEAAHFACCQRVVSDILHYVLSPRVERISIYNLIALDLDFQAYV